MADLDLQYLAGQLAILIATQLPTKSGRRRAILAEEHGQIRFEDLDMDRIVEYNTGKFLILKNFVKSTKYHFSSLAKNYHGGPLRVRIHFGPKGILQNFVEVSQNT